VLNLQKVSQIIYILSDNDWLIPFVGFVLIANERCGTTCARLFLCQKSVAADLAVDRSRNMLASKGGTEVMATTKKKKKK
jgi:hypothetical protein